ncbi:MAG: tail fiber domain-containing protein [Candidatus Absconditabacteria bacterium]|nr:tail fiber domain-containing protein [Candidatus Absconditabacteria bacterium]
MNNKTKFLKFAIAVILGAGLAGALYAQLQIESSIDNSVMTIKQINLTADGKDGPAIITLDGSSATPVTVKGSMIVGDTASNKVSGIRSSIYGGDLNNITGDQSVIAGGRNNKINATNAMIPGGSDNRVNANYGFAAGRYAIVNTNHLGTFVWSDSQGTPFISTAPNQFLIRALGGVAINTNTPVAGYGLTVAGSGNIQGNLQVGGVGNKVQAYRYCNEDGTSCVDIADIGSGLFVRSAINSNNIYNANTNNVGIGINDPQAKLHVNGSVRLEGLSSSTQVKSLMIDTNGQLSTRDLTGVAFNGEVDPKVGLLTTNRVPRRNGSTLANGTITDNGTNVGIGTTNPQSFLQIKDPSYGDQYAGIRFSPTTSPTTVNSLFGFRGAGLYIRGGEDGDNNLRAGILLNNSAITFRTMPSTSMLDRMVILNNGNIGIGTTTPGEKMHIAGDVKIDGAGGTIGGATIANGSLLIGNTLGIDDNELYFSTTSYIGTIGNFPLHIRTNSNTRLFLSSNGNIGIGTTDPTTKLDVNGNLRIRSVGLDNTATTGLLMTSNGTVVQRKFNNIAFNGETDPVWMSQSGNFLNTSATAQTKAGNLTVARLISTQAAGTAPFAVTSNTVVTNLNSDLLDGQHATYFLNTSNTPQTKNGNLTINGDLRVVGKVITDTLVNRTVENITVSGALIGSAPTVYRNLGSATTGWSKIFASLTSGSTETTVVVKGANNEFKTRTLDSVAFNGYTETDPQVSMTTTNRVPRRNGSTLINGTMTDNGTNIGIGTTSPATKLNIVGTTDTSLSAHGLFVLGGITTANISMDQNEIQARSNGSASTLYLQSEGGNLFLTNPTNGNVGIGTGSPQAKLHVNGSVIADAYYYKSILPDDNEFSIKMSQWNDSTTQAGAIYYNSGNVGIGTTTPGAKLDVNGNLKVKTPGSSWITGKTGNGGITSSTKQTATAYHPMIRQTTTSNHVINLGGLGDDFGFFGFDANRTENGYDYTLIMDLANGNIGIGTISPSTRLQVNGVITANGGNSTQWNTAYTHSQSSHLALGTTSTTAYRGDYGNIAYTHSQAAHLALGETSATAYRGDRGKIAYDHSQSSHLALGTTSTTAYRGDRGNIAYTHSQSSHLALGTTSTTAYRGDYGNIAYTHSQSAHLALGETSATAYRGDRGKIAYNGVNTATNANTASTIVKRDASGNFAAGTITASKITHPSSDLVLNGADTQVGGGIGDVGIGTNGGKVGIGITNPSSKLSVNGDIRLQGGSRYVNFDGGNGYIRTLGAYPISFMTNGGNTRMTITSNGNVGVGITSPFARLSVSGPWDTPYLFGVAADGNTTPNRFYVKGGGDTYIAGYLGIGMTGFGAGAGLNVKGPSLLSGTVTVKGSVTATAFYYSSDITLKKNLTKISNPLDKVLALNGYYFTWKSDDTKDIGLIAQEVEKVFPDAVKADDKGLKSVKYGNLVAPIIEAIKELYNKYLDQQKKIDELEIRINSLEKLLE